jgi:hypothetical protein
MFETAQELDQLERLLDRSAALAGVHMRSIITEERRVTAAELCPRLQGMRLLVLATATADGRPLTGPVDGYLIHGSFHFSSGRESVRARHLSHRPSVSATHLPGEQFAVTVHGRAELYEISDPTRPELRQAMLDHYLPLQGAEFEGWLDSTDSLGACIRAERMFTFHTDT